ATGSLSAAIRRAPSSRSSAASRGPVMKTAAILIARLIFGLDFAMAASFKFVLMGMDATAGQIAAAGFPYPLFLAWIAAFFEVALALAFLTGLFFSEAAVVSIAYVLFLGFSFHGPN